jgi:hypothetical protein
MAEFVRSGAEFPGDARGAFGFQFGVAPAPHARAGGVDAVDERDVDVVAVTFAMGAFLRALVARVGRGEVFVDLFEVRPAELQGALVRFGDLVGVPWGAGEVDAVVLGVEAVEGFAEGLELQGEGDAQAEVAVGLEIIGDSSALATDFRGDEL